MTPPTHKAILYVNKDKVVVDAATFGPNGELLTAEGTVESPNGLYRVTITPEITTCGCKYGTERRDAAGHAHDAALRLQAQTDRGET